MVGQVILIVVGALGCRRRRLDIRRRYLEV
jgi:hypothetical protein